MLIELITNVFELLVFKIVSFSRFMMLFYVTHFFKSKKLKKKEEKLVCDNNRILIAHFDFMVAT